MRAQSREWHGSPGGGRWPKRRSVSRSASRSRSRSRDARMNDEGDFLLFRQFVLTLDDSIEAEIALAKYRKYLENFKSQHAEKFYEQNRDSAFILEEYNPNFVFRQFEMKRQRTRQEAKEFAEKVERGDFEGLRLVAPDTPGEGKSTQVVDIQVEGEEGPYFIRSPDVNCLSIRQIPPDVLRWDFVDFLGPSAGVVNIATAARRPWEKGTTAWIRFDALQSAEDALTSLENFHAKGWSNCHPELVETSRHLSARTTPREAKKTSRVETDVQKSAELIRKFDEDWGLTQWLEEANIPHPVLSSTGRPLAVQLDLQILYLRRVHLMCYYSGTKKNDERKLWEAVGPAVLRPGDGDDSDASDLEMAGGETPAAHRTQQLADLDEKLDKLLAAPFLVPEPITDDDPRIASEWTRLYTDNTVPVEADRWRCSVCRKLFKGEEFVHKHLRNKHADSVEHLKKKLLDDATRTAYLADPDKTVSMPPPRRRAASPGRDGRYQRRPHRGGYRDFDLPTENKPTSGGNLRAQVRYDDL